MARLIAKRSILHLANQYNTGEELPQNDSKMVELWIKYGSAQYDDKVTSEKSESDDKKTEKKTSRKRA